MMWRPGCVAEITTQRREDSERSYDLTTVFLPKINASAELLGLIPGSYQFSKDIYTNGFCSLTDIGLRTLNQEFNFFCLEICGLLGKLGSLSLDSLHAFMLCHFSRVGLGDLLYYSLQGSSVHGILQARILECVALSSSRGPSQPRDRNLHLLHCRRILYH